MVMVRMVEFVGHGGNWRQGLQRGEGGVGAAHPGWGGVAGHAHGVMERQRKLWTVLSSCAAAAAAVQNRSHAGDHRGARRRYGQILVYPQGSPRIAVVMGAVAAHQVLLMA